MLHVNIDASLFIVLYIAHKVGDYVLQSDYQATFKSKYWTPLFLHSGIYTFVVLGAAWLFIGFFQWSAVTLVFFSHIILDQRQFETWWAKQVKRISDPNKPEVIATMMELDQSFHYLVLFIVSLMN